MYRGIPAPSRAAALTWAAFLAASLAIGMESHAFGAGSLTINPGGSLSLTGFNQSNFILNNSGLLFTTAGAGANTCFSGVLNNDGQVSLVHPFTLIGNMTLNGGGTTTLAGGTITATGPWTFVNNSLILGAGVLGAGAGMMVTNNGTISAMSGVLFLGAPLGTANFTNTGLMQANGGTLHLSPGTFSNAGGLILAAAGSLVELTSQTLLTGGSLTTVGSGTMSLSGTLTNVSLGGNGFIGAGPSLSGSNTFQGAMTTIASMGLNGTLNNAGVITLNAGLNVSAPSALTASGTIQLTGTNVISGAPLISGNLISGQGQIFSMFTNNGTVAATTGQMTLTGPSMTNNSYMTASGGTLTVITSLVNTNGTIEAMSSSTVVVSSGSVVGGGLKASAGGLLSLSSANVTGSTMDIASGAFLSLGGGTLNNVIINNAGSITVSGSPSFNGVINNQTLLNVGAQVRLNGNATLNGTGTFTLQAALISDNLASRTLVNNSLVMNGFLGNGSQLKIINNGTMVGTASPSFGLQIAVQNATDGFINHGVVRADGGRVSFSATTVQNAGGLIEALAASTITTTAANVIGGTLRNLLGGSFTIGGGLLSGTTLDGDFLLSSGGTTFSGVIPSSGLVTASSSIVLNGTLQNAGTLVIAAQVTPGGTSLAFTGGGVIQLSNSQFFNNGGTHVLYSNNRISGYGTLGNSNIKLINNGTISANSTAPMYIQTAAAADGIINFGAILADGGSLAISSAGAGTISNLTGLIQASGGGTLVLGVSGPTPLTIVGGTIRADAAVVIVAGGTLMGQQSISAINGGTLLLTPASTTDSVSSAINLVNGHLAITSGAAILASVTGSGDISIDVPAGKTVISDGLTVTTLSLNGNSTHIVRANNGTVGTSKVASLFVAAASDSSFTAKLDLTNNRLIVQAVDASDKSTKLSFLQSALRSGFNGGNWKGAGITSSTVAADQSATGSHLTSLALYDNALLNLSTFGGQSVDTNSALITTALIGDTNFDGSVNSNDFTTVVNHWQQTASDWTNGDLNNDGFVDLLDAVIVATHFSSPGTPANFALLAEGGVSADAESPPGGTGLSPLFPVTVPEPVALLPLLLLSPLFLRRRKHLNVSAGAFLTRGQY